MYYVEIVSGQVQGEPKEVSTDRTVSPNTEWSPGQMVTKGFVLVNLDCGPMEYVDLDNPHYDGTYVTYDRYPKTVEMLRDEAVAAFSSKTFFGRLIQVFDAQRWFGLSKLGIGWTMQQLVDYPNFSGLKAYATGLLMDQTISQDDADKINACLLEQNINLNDF